MNRKLHLREMRSYSLDGVDHALHILGALQDERLLWRPLRRQRCCQHLLHKHMCQLKFCREVQGSRQSPHTAMSRKVQIWTWGRSPAMKLSHGCTRGE